MLYCEVFVQKHLELLELEKEAELEDAMALQKNYSLKELQSRGVCLLNLTIKESESGMCGRKLVVFQRKDSDRDLPPNNLRSGDVVGFWQSKRDPLVNYKTMGVISEVKSKTITVALDKPGLASSIEMDKTFSLIKLSHFVTYKYMRSALLKLRQQTNVNMIEVMFGERKPSAVDMSTLQIDFINDNLNEDQKEAVKFALCQKEIAVIHGPPGTGKTTTLIEIILQLVKQGRKVLACAPSNVAADNLVECLGAYTTNIVRLGHPARTLPVCLNYNIDFLLANDDDSKIIREVQNKISVISQNLDSVEEGDTQPYSRLLKEQKRSLVAEVNKRKSKIMLQVMQSRDVIVSTLISANRSGPLRVLPPEFFDVVVIDECPQALEAACWIPLVYAQKCILAGDHRQLPPVILSEEAEKNGLGDTLMERVIKIHGDSIKKLLTLQYRMHEDIVRWPSEQLYEGLLKSHPSVANHLLHDIPGVETNENTCLPLLLIDTAGSDMWDYELDDDDSKCNEGEANLVAIHVKALIDSGLKAADIAVITPYNFQVELIRELLSEPYPSLEIRSVDGFQGREKEAVVLSLVRSNSEGNVGFLKETRRINVAITRAKRHLAVICDSKTVSNSNFLRDFLKYMKDKAEVRSSFQYMSAMTSLGKSTIITRAKEKYLQSEKRTKKSAKKRNKKPKRQDLVAFEASSAISHQVNKLEQISENKDKGRFYDKAKQREMYRNIIKEFVNSPNREMTFSALLTSYERLLIHELCEELQIKHRSEGEGEERHIVISKPDNDVCNGSEKTSASLSEKELQSESTDPNASLPVAEFPLQNGFVLSDEIASNCLQSSQTAEVSSESKMVSSHSENSFVNSEAPTCTPVNLESKKTDRKPSIQKQAALRSKKNKKPLKQSALEKTSEEDFDALLETAMKVDNSCRFASCKNHIKVLLQTCQFCNFRFCLTHHLPEIHGCGAAAKAHARSMIRKEGVICPAKNPEANRRHLARLMEIKLAEFSKKRKHDKK